MSTLALTMIVRDEAEQLPAFFAHHQGLAEEIVVVDTGSADDSVAIAEACGARVIVHEWGDDFAAARNVGLVEVTADWVLFLDADEKVSQRDFGVVRRALDTETDRVFLMETRNYCLGTSHLEWQPVLGEYPNEESGQTGLFIARRVGLFPRLPALVFSGCVHETVLPASQKLGLPCSSLPVPVHHYGYARSVAVNEARHTRYRRLLSRKYAENPHDPASQLEWATVLIESGEAVAALEPLMALVGGPARARPVVRGLVLLGRLRREMGEFETARELLNEAVRQDPDFMLGWLERIRVETAQANWTEAESLLSAAERRLGGRQPQLLRESLLIKIKMRRLVEGLAAAEDLVRFCPQWQEIRDLTARIRRLTEPSGGP